MQVVCLGILCCARGTILRVACSRPCQSQCRPHVRVVVLYRRGTTIKGALSIRARVTCRLPDGETRESLKRRDRGASLSSLNEIATIVADDPRARGRKEGKATGDGGGSLFSSFARSIARAWHPLIADRRQDLLIVLSDLLSGCRWLESPRVTLFRCISSRSGDIGRDGGRHR